MDEKFPCCWIGIDGDGFEIGVVDAGGDGEVGGIGGVACDSDGACGVGVAVIPADKLVAVVRCGAQGDLSAGCIGAAAAYRAVVVVRGID